MTGELELDRLRQENERLKGEAQENQKELEELVSKHNAVMFDYESDLSSRDAVIGLCKDALGHGIEGVSFYFYLTTQYPATVGNLQIIEWRDRQTKALAAIATLETKKGNHEIK